MFKATFNLIPGTIKGYMLLLLLLTISVDASFSQEVLAIKIPKYKRAWQAYGFLVSQEYTLNKIEQQFPTMNIQVLKTKAQFNLSFGRSKSNIEAYFKGLYLEKYPELVNAMSTKVAEVLTSQKIDQDGAVNFLNSVEKRSMSAIESPILETLLSFQYQDKPEEEFLTRNIKTFKTKNHLKAKGTDWQITVPKSWYQKEGDRPNVIQTFTNDFGDGKEMIMLMVRDFVLSKGEKFTKADEMAFFSDKFLKSQMPKGTKFISHKRIILDNYPGGMLITEQLISRLGVTLKARVIQYRFLRKNKLYFLQCMVGGVVDDNLDITMQKFLPLYNLVANSLVENDQYK